MGSVLDYPERTLAIMPTYACPAACKNCGTISHPSDKNHLTIEAILQSIHQAKALNFTCVVFTGGEATLRWTELIAGIQLATELDLPTRLVTNAHWAQSDVETLRILQDLIDAGLREINFSTGDEHVRFVPVENVVLATLAALRTKLTVALMIETRKSSAVTRQSLLDLLTVASLDASVLERLSIIESPWMPLNPNTVAEYPEGMVVNRSNIHASRGCESVLQTYVVGGDGRVSACCGLGMRLIEELKVSNVVFEGFLEQAILDSEEDLIKQALRAKGPIKLLAWAASKDASIVWEDMYAHACQACLRIYKDEKVRAVLRQHSNELIVAYLNSRFLDNVLIPLALNQSRAAELQVQVELPPSVTRCQTDALIDRRA